MFCLNIRPSNRQDCVATQLVPYLTSQKQTRHAAHPCSPEANFSFPHPRGRWILRASLMRRLLSPVHQAARTPLALRRSKAPQRRHCLWSPPPRQKTPQTASTATPKALLTILTCSLQPSNAAPQVVDRSAASAPLPVATGSLEPPHVASPVAKPRRRVRPHKRPAPIDNASVPLPASAPFGN